jgi:hypothetical protein
VGYLEMWNVLEEILTSFRKQRIHVSAKILKDLRSAKTLITISQANPNSLDLVQKIEEFLFSIESHLISEGQKVFSDDCIVDWLEKLEISREKAYVKRTSTKLLSRFPRKHRWIRVKPLPELSILQLKEVAQTFHLSYKIQKDGVLLFCGEEKQIKAFLKNISLKRKFQ